MTAIYSARNAPVLKTKAVIFKEDGKTIDRVEKIAFRDGVYKTDDKQIEAALDREIEKSVSMAALITKLDREAALKVSQEWAARRAAQNLVARGGTDSESANLARRAEQMYNEAISEGHPPEVAKQLVDEMRNENNYVMPDRVDPESGANTPNDGFQEGAKGKEADPDADVSKSVPEGTEEQAASAKEVAGAPSMKQQGNPFGKGK